ncbi:uncharacterized protein SCHCODRAFT_02583149 [Schizophyllum commune H4-8]|nr:uncharacterized protein SCHCODRAFT_02583149 [Schizophyllum commune H4-8]KAI5890310.1 hypothetical protein SCHCODRAFT_02583149 [Schizophyllum commune H4-8]
MDIVAASRTVAQIHASTAIALQPLVDIVDDTPPMDGLIKRQASREPSTGSVSNKDSASSRPKKSKKSKKSRKTRNRINDDDLDHTAFNAALEQFTHIGKIFGRYCNANDPILDIFEVGINRDPHAPRSQFTTDNNMLYDAYSLLSSLYPKTVDYFLEIAHRSDCQAILRAYADAAGASRTQARSDDVKGVKSAIVFWTQNDFSKPHPGPLNKAVAGYHHPDCARLIAPTIVDPVDEVARNKLLKLEIPRKPSDLCRLLYEGEDFKNNDAFLKHPYLVKCYKHVFCGPSAAVANDGDSAKQRASNGDIHGVREVSIPAIAYCACLVHFALSSQANFAFGGNRGWHKKRREALLIWWDERVYVDRHSNVADAIPSDSTAATMQDAFRAEAEEEARAEAEEEARTAAEERAHAELEVQPQGENAMHED